MLSGREIWGFPKKFAAIDFKTDRDMIFGTLERRAGIRLASAVMRPERPADNRPSAPRPPVSLRIIRSPEENAQRPTSADLIETIAVQRVIEAWTGTGSVAFAARTALDPWNRLPVKRTFGANYMVYDMTLGFRKIIDRFKWRATSPAWSSDGNQDREPRRQ